MNILVTICARAGSKGLENKNIKLINGVPLVNYTLDKYLIFKNSIQGNIKLAINTDSPELVVQVKEYEVDFEYVERKESLAGDKVGKLEVIKDTLKVIECRNNKEFDIVIDLDLTSPLREDEDIKGVFDKLNDEKNLDVVFSVVPSRRSPWFNMVRQNLDGSCSLVIESNFLTRQEAPKCYDMNASIYAYRRDFLLNERTKKVLDGKAGFYVMKDYGILDIDSEEDFERIVSLMRQ